MYMFIFVTFDPILRHIFFISYFYDIKCIYLQSALYFQKFEYKYDYVTEI